jgi:3-phenylpropionate/trans-cinnamate dioxygenase ferredoxin component
VRVPTVALAQFEPGARKIVRHDGYEIALFNVGGDIYAIEASCPHAGSSLAMGRLCGRTIHCRAHGLRFDLATGCMPGVDGLRARTYPVVIENGAIFVELPDEA